MTSGADRPRGGGGPAGRAPRRPAPDAGEPEPPRGPIPIRRALHEQAGAAGDAASDAAGRRFEAGGQAWIARPAGESAIGHGAGARAYLVAVRFYREGEETPVSEVLIPRGRLEALYDEELEDLLRRATPLASEPERPERPERAERRDAGNQPPPEG